MTKARILRGSATLKEIEFEDDQALLNLTKTDSVKAALFNIMLSFEDNKNAVLFYTDDNCVSHEIRDNRGEKLKAVNIKRYPAYEITDEGDYVYIKGIYSDPVPDL